MHAQAAHGQREPHRELAPNGVPLVRLLISTATPNASRDRQLSQARTAPSLLHLLCLLLRLLFTVGADVLRKST
eukprot:scaffold9851_cov100-Isochrysis_galbana.AAC.6